MNWPKSEQWLFLFNMLLSKLLNARKKISKASISSILVVKYDEIGDVITSMHVFELLQKQYPNAKITALVKPYCTELLSNHPSVSEIINSPKKWDKKYDMVVELRGTWSTFFKSLMFRPKLRFDRGTVRFRNRGSQKHEVNTNFEIIEKLVGKNVELRPKMYTSSIAVAAVSNWIQSHNLKQYCVLHVGARSELRRWSAQNFAVLADFLANNGYSVVFAGTREEKNQIQAVQDNMKNESFAFTDGFNLQQLAELMRGAQLFVGNESGPLQLADVLELPLIALYGPGVPTVFYPRNPNARIIHHVLSCNPCDQIHCVRPENTCMQMITTGEVLQEAGDLLHLNLKN